MSGKTSIPTKAWKAEYAKLTAERKTLNQRYLALKDEVKEAGQIRKKCLHHFAAGTAGTATEKGAGNRTLKKWGGGIDKNLSRRPA